MQAYQADIAKFEAAGTQIIALSVDSAPANGHWRKELGVTFPILSDFMRTVSKDYGVLDPVRGFASRATFVVDKEGIIRHIEQGGSAIDPTGAYQACTVELKKP